MQALQPPPVLQLTGNVAENWRKFKQRFELYLTAIGADEESAKTKASVFLHIVGEEALEVYNNFQFQAQADKMSLAKILEKFEEYCIPKRNVTFERHRFFTCVQKTGETIDQYVTELRNRSKTCEFGGLTDSLIKDRLVCGIPDNGLRERLLREQDLNLEKAINMCRAAETVKTQAKELVSESCNVDAVRRDERRAARKKSAAPDIPSEMNPAQRDMRGKACGRCGTQHPAKKCPAFGKVCHNCNKMNHFSRNCKSQAKQSKVHALNESDSEEFYVDVVTEQNADKKDWIMELKVNDTDIVMKLDTGAQANVISETVFNKIRPRPKLHATKVKVSGYSGATIPVKGKCMVKVSHKGRGHTLAFIVVPGNVQTILGLSACERLNLVKSASSGK